MPITRHLREPRYSGISVHNGVAHFAAVANEKPGAPFHEQAVDVLRRVDEKLAIAGSAKDRLIYVAVYLADIRMLREFNEVWDAWVDQQDSPSRYCVEAKPPDPAYLVELFCTAAI